MLQISYSNLKKNKQKRLLNDFAKPGIIDLNIGLEIRDADIERRDSALEKKTDVVGIVCPCIPDVVGTGGSEAVLEYIELGRNFAQGSLFWMPWSKVMIIQTMIVTRGYTKTA